MTSTFPALMRKTHFASYDPLIHRIYTSPSASAAKGDWGLKYSLPPSKRDRSQYRNIKVQSLDAGQGLGCDYKSGETEARFMERWGNGRHGWVGGDDLRGRTASTWVDGLQLGASHRTSSFLRPATRETQTVERDTLVDQQVSVQAPREKVEPIVDLEFMSEERFEAYLEEVRFRRGELLAWKQDKFAEAQEAAATRDAAGSGNGSSRGERSEEAPQSLWAELAQKKVPGREVGEFRSEQLLKDLQGSSSASSKTPLMSFSHPTHGLAYAEYAPGIESGHPLTVMPGRSLGMVSQEQNRYANNNDARSNWGSAKRPNANEQVIGIGGIAATASSSSTIPFRAEDIIENGMSNGTPDQGSFRIRSALIKSPPSIVTTSARTGRKTMLPSEQNLKLRRNAPAGGAKPMDDFRFGMEVIHSAEHDRRAAERSSLGAVPGEKSWVAYSHTEPRDTLTATLVRKLPPKNETVTGYEEKGRDTMDHLKEAMAMIHQPKAQRANRNGYSTSFRAFSTAALSNASRRGFSTSASRSSEDKPTASVTPEQMKGDAPITGPGVGGAKEAERSNKPEENLAKGEWRQIEENVAGEVRYGGEAPEGTVKKE